MPSIWGRTTVLVRDYAEALDFYRDGFDFEPIFDSGPENEANPIRFLHLGHAGVATLWLIKASENEQHLIGTQTGSEPLGVLYVDDLDIALEKLARIGAVPTTAPSADATSRFAHVPDLYGNDIIIVQMIR